MQNPKIKIYISCHKECEVLRNKYVYPIQVGTTLADTKFANMLHDNEGDNISDLNPMYCELTAQYWAWKNDDADYYGFMHYRRYFSFNSRTMSEDAFGNILMKGISKENIDKLCLNEEKILRFVPKYDVITLIPNDMTKIGSPTVYHHAKFDSPFHRIEDLDKIVEIIEKKYPEFVPATKKYLESKRGYFCNMYILRKDIFEEYSKWLFDILEEHRMMSNFEDYSIDEYRVSGFWAERLWGIYYTYLKEKFPKLRYKEVQKTLFEDTSLTEKILPAYNKNNIPVVFAANNQYVPVLGVAISSLLAHKAPQNNYDILILQRDISIENQRIFKREFIDKNISVRFLNVERFFAKKKYNTPAHFTMEIYFRLILPELLDSYDKVLYLDSDLVVNKDVCDLYNTQIEGKLLAAVEDIDSAGCYKEFDLSRKKYFENILKIEEPYKYFNSGVLIMNLKEFRRLYSVQYILSLAENKNLLFPDQDILNMISQGKVYYLDPSWNVVMNYQDGVNSRLKVARLAPKRMYLNYIKARENPKIVHYAGFQKPWNVPDCDMAEYFWRYARVSPNYEQLVYKLKKMASENKRKPLYEKLEVRKIANKVLPIGSQRRKIVKKLAKIVMK